MELLIAWFIGVTFIGIGINADTDRPTHFYEKTVYGKKRFKKVKVETFEIETRKVKEDEWTEPAKIF